VTAPLPSWLDVITLPADVITHDGWAWAGRYWDRDLSATCGKYWAVLCEQYYYGGQVLTLPPYLSNHGPVDDEWTLDVARDILAGLQLACQRMKQLDDELVNCETVDRSLLRDDETAKDAFVMRC